MATFRTRLKIPVWVVAVVALLAAGTVAAVTVSSLSFNPIEPAEGQVTNSADLAINGSDITYAGLNATQVDITINNTGGSAHTVDAEVTIKDSANTVQDTAVQTGVNVPAGGSTTITFNVNVRVSNLANVEVFVEQTS